MFLVFLAYPDPIEHYWKLLIQIILSVESFKKKIVIVPTSRKTLKILVSLYFSFLNSRILLYTKDEGHLEIAKG